MTDMPLVFVDTETTGLTKSDQVWEVAAVRRDPDGTTHEIHQFIDHDRHLCRRLPKAFRNDHDSRFPGCGGAISRSEAAQELRKFLPTGKFVWVGSNPEFDFRYLDELVAEILDATYSRPAGINRYHHAVDVHTLMLGYLAGQHQQQSPHGIAAHITYPAISTEDLSRAIGVEPDEYERHTAMGDVLWTIAIWDRIAGAGIAGGDQ